MMAMRVIAIPQMLGVRWQNEAIAGAPIAPSTAKNVVLGRCKRLWLAARGRMSALDRRRRNERAHSTRDGQGAVHRAEEQRPHVRDKLETQPLQLGQGAFVLVKVVLAVIGRSSQMRCSRGTIAAQQMPFATVELRLAALLGLAGERQELRR